MTGIEYSKKNNSPKTPWMAFFIIQLLLILHFIPLPRLFGMPFAPVNLVFLFSGLFLFIKFNIFARLNKRVFFLFVLLIFYFFMEFSFSLIRGESGGSVIGKLRIIYFMFFITVFLISEKHILSLIKTFVFLTVFSVIFGTLLYLFGEPFTTIREWLAGSQSTTETIIIGKGSMLTGIYCIPHIFGYLLAITPIICLSLYFAEKKIIWMVFFTVCLIGLLLNAERSALLMNVFVISIFIIKQKKRAMMIFVILFSFMGFVLAQKHLFIDSKTLDASEANYTTGNLSERLAETSLDHVIKRLEWQLYGAGVVLKHPVLGATSEQYSMEMRKIRLGSSLSMSSAKELAPHNHYVNVGLKAGILGWGVMGIIFLIIIRIFFSDISSKLNNDKLKKNVIGLKLSVIAGLGNGIFHNAGLFSAELATCVSLAMLLTLYSIAEYKYVTN